MARSKIDGIGVLLHPRGNRRNRFPSGLWVCSMMQERIRHINATICGMKIVDQFPVLASPHVPGKMQCTLAFIIPLAQLRCMFNPQSKARITMQQTLISLDNLLSCYLWRDGARGRQYVKETNFKIGRPSCELKTVERCNAH